MRADAREQPLPVERVADAQDQVDDVGHVVAVALVDEQAVPDQLFRRGDAHRLRRQHAGRLCSCHSASMKATPLPIP